MDSRQIDLAVAGKHVDRDADQAARGRWAGGGLRRRVAVLEDARMERAGLDCIGAVGNDQASRSPVGSLYSCR